MNSREFIQRCFVFLISFVDLSVLMQNDIKKCGLIFGGNGFIGAETVLKLLEEGFILTCVSRGNWFWDSEDRIKPRVTHISCDRKRGLRLCSEFMTLIENKTSFDVVVDFSGYNPNVVEETTTLLKGLARAYIYISSDSVYEVSVQKNHDGPHREDDARRPDSLYEQEKLKRFDSYGHKKLACEEVLEKQKLNGGIPYVVLRLPDVIGARDSTERWWTYQLWIQFYNSVQHPIPIPSRLHDLRTSYVYVKDVANVIALILKNLQVKDQVFNVASDLQFTLQDLLLEMQKYLQVPDVKFDLDNPIDYHLFPSVTRGSIDSSRIKDALKWAPIPWNEVISETVEFYRSALLNFPRERSEIIQSLMEFVVTSDHKDTFLEALGQEVEYLANQFQASFQLQADLQKQETQQKTEL